MAGAGPPTPTEIAETSLAAQNWAANVRDLPDPVGYKDFAARPDLTAERILERHRTERFPFEVHMFPLRKSGGLRRISWLDPFDDLTLRVFVGRLTPELEQACRGSTILSYPHRPGLAYQGSPQRRQGAPQSWDHSSEQACVPCSRHPRRRGLLPHDRHARSTTPAVMPTRRPSSRAEILRANRLRRASLPAIIRSPAG